MNQFPTLIEYLLLNHDYVVIPGLGTFIVQQMNAKRNEVEEVFLPPIRSVRFNTELSHADNHIYIAIENIFRVTRQQAEQMLTTWVEDFQQILEDEEYLEFGALGIFSKEKGHDLLFSPQEAGVTTPEYYGLDAFHMSAIQAAPKAEVIPLTASMEANDKAIIIRINRRIANMVVAACAVILLFVFINNPMPNLDTTGLQSSVTELLIPSASSAPSTKVAESTETVVKEAATPIQEAAPAVKTTLKEEQPAKEEYCIVMACAISMQNAENFVTRLKEEGFDNPRIVTNNKMVRVVVGHYTTETEAFNASHEIHQRFSKYRSAWVHHISL